MSMVFSRIRSCAMAAASAAAIGFAMVPATAQAGFFESLFGGNPEPQAAPAYNYDAPAGEMPGSRPRVIHRPHKHVVKDEKPVLQKATDIWHDQTLQDGDAVMMKDGLHVYNGPNGEKPRARDLPRLDEADLSRKKRALLVAMDTTQNDPLRSGAARSGAAPDTIASGRSAAVASASVPGYKITDARGKSVRYVGP